MSIFILEDHPIQAQQMKQLVEEICYKHQMAYDFIEVTGKAKTILDKMSHATYIPIYFLDIQIKNEERQGLQVAKEIRKYDSRGIIVFVTTHSELAPISYQYMVSALTFIDKGETREVRYDLFEQCLRHYQALNANDAPRDDFIVESSRATVRVPFKTVEYIMTDAPHRLILAATQRLVHFYGTLKEIESIDGRLMRCHQSYVVNTMQIASYDRTQQMLNLKSGKRIPVSRRLVRKVRERLKEKC